MHVLSGTVVESTTLPWDFEVQVLLPTVHVGGEAWWLLKLCCKRLQGGGKGVNAVCPGYHSAMYINSNYFLSGDARRLCRTYSKTNWPNSTNVTISELNTFQHAKSSAYTDTRSSF